MYLTRQIENILKESLKEFPVVALMGPRQSGKSTTLKQLFDRTYKYITLDDLSIRSQAKKDPALFFKNNPGKLILDEIQYAPEVLPELKIRIDKSNLAGQYLLTGSQQFQMISDLRETLAGRVLILKLPVMTLMEKSGAGKKKHWLTGILEKEKPVKSDFALYPKEIFPALALLQGGLPPILTKTEKFYSAFFNSYIKTYIERDLPSQYDVKDHVKISGFLKLLAPLSSAEINKSQLGREIEISPPTSQRWLEWLKAGFIWNEHPAYHGNLLKRVSKHPKGFIFDSGVACSLLNIHDADTLQTHPLTGGLFESAIRIEFEAVINNTLLPAECYHWRTPYGHEIDIVIEYKKKLFAFECKWGGGIRSDDVKNLLQFKKIYGKAVAFMGIVVPYGHLMELEHGIWQVPWFRRE